MNKYDLIQSVAEKLSLDVTGGRKAINAVTEAITESIVNGDKVTITGFGTFAPVQRNERTARNPINGEQIHVPAKTAVVFRAGSGLRDRVNGDGGGSE